MTAPELVQALHSRGVQLSRLGDRLRFRPVQAVSPELVEEMRRHKTELLSLLGGLATPAQCGWCGAALAPYLLHIASGPALLCTSCHRWTAAGGIA